MSYEQGFIDKCAERGVDPERLLAKIAERDADMVNPKRVSDNPELHKKLLAQNKRYSKPAPKPRKTWTTGKIPTSTGGQLDQVDALARGKK